MKEIRVSVIGLGKAGAPIAIALAYRGIKTIGVDKRLEVVNHLNNKIPHIYEPEFEYLLKLTNNFFATTDILYAILNTDITMIVVNTPSNEDGSYSLEQVFEVGRRIGEALKLKNSYHLIALISTVMPGDTIKLKNLIEEVSGKVAGKDFGICYNPGFIALGSVIRYFLNPDFVLIGENDKKSGDILEELYKLVCLNNPPIIRMNIINAEIAKIAFNSFGTIKITFANFLAELCEKYEGADVDVITRTIVTDRRIGGKDYFIGGTSYGGPCLPRDNRAIALVADRVKVNSSLPRLIDSLNKHFTERIADIIKQNLKDNSTITILGLTYKPNTDVIEESVGINLSNILLKSGNYNLKLYDPLAKNNLKHAFDDKRVRICENIHEAIKDTDAIVITVLHKEFEELPNIIKDGREILIIDCWRNFKNQFSNKVKYYALGIGKKKENS
jgi:UDPglucose 6-dehydrogenase